MTTMTTLQGHCSRCGKVWTLNERQGVCSWCNKPASCITATSKPRHIKSRSKVRQKQAEHNGNGYDRLDGEWLIYYKVASHFTNRVKAQDKEDILHTIIVTLADIERNNGHKPFTEGTMYRIASRTVADYWRAYYKANNGLDCHTCSKAQRRKCKEDDLYTECPKAIKLEYLSKPIMDGDGNLTELGELIADPDSLDLDAWDKGYLWQIGYPVRLVDIAYKLHRGQALTHGELCYMSRLRKREQKSLFD